MKVNDVLKKTSIQFNIRGMKKKELLPIYSKLKKFGYTEENIFQRLGAKDIEYILVKYFPIYLNFRLSENTPLDRLIRLFQLGRHLEDRELEELFNSEEINLSSEVGLLSHDERGYFATADLFPCRGGIFATDHRFTENFSKYHVYPPGLDSYMLARGMIEDKSRRTLDLCTGSGIQAILASRFSKKVVGVDVNHRAINFARFNALLNQVDNVTFLPGDLYEPVNDKKFDLILANPPFVPAPQQSILFRDGDKSGEAILERILRGIQPHINRGGHAQIVTLLVFSEEVTYYEKLKDWLSNGDFQVNVLASRYKDVESYILEHVDYDMDYSSYSDEVKRWLKTYQSEKIKKLADGLISMKYTPGIPFYLDFQDIKPTNKMFSEKIKASLDSMVEISEYDGLDKLGKCEFDFSEDVDFFWKGRHKDGKEKWGVLFTCDSPGIDEELNKLHWIALNIIADGIKEGNKIKKELKKRTINTIKINNRLFFHTMQYLLQKGIIRRKV